MAIRLIAIDIDGTLTNSHGEIPRVNHLAINHALDRGIKIALATGRSFHHTRLISDNLHHSVKLILNNGALIKSSSGETLERCVIPKATAAYIIEATRAAREGVLMMFDEPEKYELVAEGVDWNHPNRQTYYELHQSIILEVDSLLDALSHDPIQVSFNGSVDAMRALAELLTSLPRAREFSHTLTEYVHRDFSLLDVLTAGCSKGATLQRLAKRLAISRDEIMAIGDNLNDRDMLEFAGLAIVMGNAVPELKARGWPVTGNHDDGGLATAMEQFVFQSM